MGRHRKQQRNCFVSYWPPWVYHSDVTWAPWNLKSPTHWLFNSLFSIIASQMTSNAWSVPMSSHLHYTIVFVDSPWQVGSKWSQTPPGPSMLPVGSSIHRRVSLPSMRNPSLQSILTVVPNGWDSRGRMMRPFSGANGASHIMAAKVSKNWMIEWMNDVGTKNGTKRIMIDQTRAEKQ